MNERLGLADTHRWIPPSSSGLEVERASAVVAVDEVDDVVAGIGGWERNGEVPMEPVVSEQKEKVFKLK